MKKVLYSLLLAGLANHANLHAETHTLEFTSDGVPLKAYLHTPANGGIDALVVYLHGNPGGPLEPDSWLAGPLLENGIALFRFNYRGLWGNGGTFNLANGIGDLRSALTFLAESDTAAEYGIADDDFFLFGYSFGTAVALIGAGDVDTVAGIASLTPCDHGYFGAEFAKPDSPIKDFLDEATASLFGEGGPVRQDASIFVDDLVENSDRYRFPPVALSTRNKSLLFVAGTDDSVCFAEDHFFPLYRALQDASHPATEVRVLQMDHGMRPVGRDRIASILADWVAAATQNPVREQAMSNEALESFARTYTAAWNGGDPREVANHYAPDGSLTINGGEPSEGRDAIAAVAGSFMTGFPDMELAFDGLEFQDGRVLYHWTFRGTNSGPGGTGNAVDFSGSESWEFDEEGLVRHSLGNFDEAEYRRQLEAGADPE